jgi:hypothetical protein
MALISNNSHRRIAASAICVSVPLGIRMRQSALAILAGILLGGSLLGCAVSLAEHEATRRAWAERDAERERECLRAGQGRWVAGGCVLGGGGAGGM